MMNNRDASEDFIKQGQYFSKEELRNRIAKIDMNLLDYQDHPLSHYIEIYDNLILIQENRDTLLYYYRIDPNIFQKNYRRRDLTPVNANDSKKTKLDKIHEINEIKLPPQNLLDQLVPKKKENTVINNFLRTKPEEYLYKNKDNIELDDNEKIYRKPELPPKNIGNQSDSMIYQKPAISRRIPNNLADNNLINDDYRNNGDLSSIRNVNSKIDYNNKNIIDVDIRDDIKLIDLKRNIKNRNEPEELKPSQKNANSLDNNQRNEFSILDDDFSQKNANSLDNNQRNEFSILDNDYNPIIKKNIEKKLPSSKNLVNLNPTENQPRNIDFKTVNNDFESQNQIARNEILPSKKSSKSLEIIRNELRNPQNNNITPQQTNEKYQNQNQPITEETKGKYDNLIPDINDVKYRNIYNVNKMEQSMEKFNNFYEPIKVDSRKSLDDKIIVKNQDIIIETTNEKSIKEFPKKDDSRKSFDFNKDFKQETYSSKQSKESSTSLSRLNNNFQSGFEKPFVNSKMNEGLKFQNNISSKDEISQVRPIKSNENKESKVQLVIPVKKYSDDEEIGEKIKVNDSSSLKTIQMNQRPSELNEKKPINSISVPIGRESDFFINKDKNIKSKIPSDGRASQNKSSNSLPNNNGKSFTQYTSLLLYSFILSLCALLSFGFIYLYYNSNRNMSTVSSSSSSFTGGIFDRITTVAVSSMREFVSFFLKEYWEIIMIGILTFCLYRFIFNEFNRKLIAKKIYDKIKVDLKNSFDPSKDFEHGLTLDQIINNYSSEFNISELEFKEKILPLLKELRKKDTKIREFQKDVNGRSKIAWQYTD